MKIQQFSQWLLFNKLRTTHWQSISTACFSLPITDTNWSIIPHGMLAKVLLRVEKKCVNILHEKFLEFFQIFFDLLFSFLTNHRFFAFPAKIQEARREWEKRFWIFFTEQQEENVQCRMKLMGGKWGEKKQETDQRKFWMWNFSVLQGFLQCVMNKFEFNFTCEISRWAIQFPHLPYNRVTRIVIIISLCEDARLRCADRRCRYGEIKRENVEIKIKIWTRVCNLRFPFTTFDIFLFKSSSQSRLIKF